LVGSAISEFNGGLEWSDYLKQGYSQFVDGMARVSGSYGGGINGAVLGAGAGLVGVLSKDKKEDE
jgi:hypothetical protein